MVFPTIYFLHIAENCEGQNEGVDCCLFSLNKIKFPGSDYLGFQWN